MSDRRKHRGAHPRDASLFAAPLEPILRRSTEELSWLLGRGYNDTSAVALVGNRHSLTSRQRTAIKRSACTDSERADRHSRRIAAPAELGTRALVIDGFNCVIAIEAALAGGVILVGRDGVVRDMASVHGSYRRVEETDRALELIASTLAENNCQGKARFYIDRPVSNSGRLATMIREIVGARVATECVLDNNPDRRLIESGPDEVACSGDALILNHCGSWLDLPAAVIAHHQIEHWRLDLRDPDPVN